VLSPGVRINSWALGGSVRSVILHNTRIGRGIAVVRNAII